LAAGAAFVLRARDGAPAPRLEMAATIYSFTGADGNADVECTFGIRNAGRAPLVLRNVHADCTCTHAKVDKTSLAAGESTTLRATYHTPERMGRAGANVAIETNDPARPKVFVRVEGTPYMEGQDPSAAAGSFGSPPSPVRVSAGDRSVGTSDHQGVHTSPGGSREITRSIAVWAWGNYPVTVEGVNVSADWLDAVFVPESRRPVSSENLGQIIIRTHGAPLNGDASAEVQVTARAGDQILRRTVKVVVDMN
jgi:hypothetical protein